MISPLNARERATLWQVATGAYMTGARAAKLGFNIDPICSRCGFEADTIHHRCFVCTFVPEEVRLEAFGPQMLADARASRRSLLFNRCVLHDLHALAGRPASDMHEHNEGLEWTEAAKATGRYIAYTDGHGRLSECWVGGLCG